MWFIINRFVSNMMRDCSLEFETKYNNSINSNIVCDMYIRNLDSGLRNLILSMTYQIITGYDNKYTSKGEFVSRDPIYSTYSVASSIGCDDNSVNIKMNDLTYGEIINKLDAEIRRYYTEHSRIDAINGKK